MTSVDDVAASLRETVAQLDMSNYVFVCIGTDRSTGDSLGPLIGTALLHLGFPVIGTLDDPCHAENIADLAAGIPEGTTIIAIDACLGQASSIGNIYVELGPIKPGAGVGRDLPPIGHMNITGIVNVGGFMEYLVLQNTRFSTVTRMAEVIVNAIEDVFPSTAVAEVAAASEESSVWRRLKEAFYLDFFGKRGE